MKAILSTIVTLLATTPIPTTAEFRRFDGPINAASNYIHYSEGYVITPGSVDISNLVFASADDGGTRSKYIPEERDWTDDDEEGEFDDDNDLDRRLDQDNENEEIAAGSTVRLLFVCYLMLSDA